MARQFLRVYNRVVTKRKLQKEYELPLVEFGVELRNKQGEKRELFGFVPEGLDRSEAVKLVIEQNDGSCSIERGKYDSVNRIDLSEFTWIKQIALNDGFKVEDWLQIRNRHGEFEVGSAKGKSFWENANTKKVKQHDNRIMITEDYGMTAELPDIDKMIDGEEKAHGGCGGAVTADELELAAGIAKWEIERDAEYSINLDTGEIREKTPLKFVEFDYKPNETPLQQISVQNFNEIRNEQQTFLDAGIFTDNKQLRLHEFAELDTVYIAAKALRDEEPVEIQSTPVITSNNETDVSQANQNQAEFKQEESMIIRLLMNPAERKLWGKLYGLPDDEEIRKANEVSKKESKTAKIKQIPLKQIQIKPVQKRLTCKKEEKKDEPAKTAVVKQEIKNTPEVKVKQTVKIRASPVKIQEPKLKLKPILTKTSKAKKKMKIPEVKKPKEIKEKKVKRKFLVKERDESKKIAAPKQKTDKKQTKKEIVDKKKEIRKNKLEIKPTKENKKKETKPEIPENKAREKKKRTDKAHASFSKKKKPRKTGKSIANCLLTEDIRHLFGKQPGKEIQQECN